MIHFQYFSFFVLFFSNYILASYSPPTGDKLCSDGMWEEVRAKTPFLLPPVTRGSYAIAQDPNVENRYYVFGGLRERLEQDWDPYSQNSADFIEPYNDLWRLDYNKTSDEFEWNEVIPLGTSDLPALSGNLQMVYVENLLVDGELRSGLFSVYGGGFPSKIFNGGFTLDAVLGIRFGKNAWFFDIDSSTWFDLTASLKPVGFNSLPRVFGWNIFLDPENGDPMIFGGIVLKALLNPALIDPSVNLDDYPNVVGYNTLYRIHKDTLDVTIETHGNWTAGLNSDADPGPIDSESIFVDPFHTGSFLPYSGDAELKYVIAGGSDPFQDSSQTSPSAGDLRAVLKKCTGELTIQQIAPNLSFDPPLSSTRGITLDLENNIHIIHGGDSPAPEGAPSCSAGEPENPSNVTFAFRVTRIGAAFSTEIIQLEPENKFPEDFTSIMFNQVCTKKNGKCNGNNANKIRTELKGVKRLAALRFVDSDDKPFLITFGGYNFNIPFDNVEQKFGCQQEFASEQLISQFEFDPITNIPESGFFGDSMRNFRKFSVSCNANAGGNDGDNDGDNDGGDGEPYYTSYSSYDDEEEGGNDVDDPDNDDGDEPYYTSYSSYEDEEEEEEEEENTDDSRKRSLKVRDVKNVEKKSTNNIFNSEKTVRRKVDIGHSKRVSFEDWEIMMDSGANQAKRNVVSVKDQVKNLSEKDQSDIRKMFRM